MALKISEEAKVQMPMKTVASLICMVAIGTWAYFGINEKLNQHSTTLELFRCITCGTDLKQHINGKISYIPQSVNPKDIKLEVSTTNG